MEGSAVTVVIAGLSVQLGLWLERRVADIAVIMTRAAQDTLEAAAGESCRLIVLDETLVSAEPNILADLRKSRVPARLPIIYVLQEWPGGERAAHLIHELGVRHLVFNPLDREELARLVAGVLGASLQSPVGADPQGKGLTPAIAALWEQFKGPVVDQVRTLERSAHAALEGTLSPELRAQAERDAHQLAGSLATVGFPEGSRLARDIEWLLRPGRTHDQPGWQRLPALAAALRQVLETEPEESSHPEGFAPASSQGLDAQRAADDDGGEARILAVDDDPQVLRAVGRLLEPRRVTVLTLDDSLRFWETLAEASPDLVVLDVDMPYLSGIEICRAIRNDPRWKSLPVVFLTASSGAGAVNRVFAAGADDYVSKPIVGPELVTRILNRLERVHLLRRMAETDRLTGAASRARGLSILEHLLRLAARQRQPFSLAVVDLDHFKQINDRFGHAVGDVVLRHVGQHLLRSFRGEDIVARLGGEEFVLGLFGMVCLDGRRRLEDVLDALRRDELAGPDGSTFRITFSAGIVEAGGTTDLQALYRAADKALYRAKEAGRNRIEIAASDGSASAEPSPGPGPSPLAPFVGDRTPRVLVVDDLAANVKVLIERLAQWGCTAAGAAGGAEALRLARSFQPDMILLDILMPDLSGFEVCQALRADPATAHIAVIFVTALRNEEEKMRAFETGARDYITKPFSPTELAARLGACLRQKYEEDELRAGQVAQYAGGLAGSGPPRPDRPA